MRLLLALLLSVTSLPALAQGQVLRSDGLQVELRSQVQPPPLNQMHSWLITLRNADGAPLDGARIRVEGGMPAHDHGLATRPEVTAEQGEGRYLLEGVRFHMAGEWLLQLQIEHGGQLYHVDVAVQL
jgi:hypothetical protein